MLTRCVNTILHPLTSLFHSFSSVIKLAPIARRVRSACHAVNGASIRRATCFIVCLGLILSSRPIFPRAVGKSAEKPKKLS